MLPGQEKIPAAQEDAINAEWLHTEIISTLQNESEATKPRLGGCGKLADYLVGDKSDL